MNVIRMVHIHYLAVDSMPTVWIQPLVKVSVRTCMYVCVYLKLHDCAHDEASIELMYIRILLTMDCVCSNANVCVCPF